MVSKIAHSEYDIASTKNIMRILRILKGYNISNWSITTQDCSIFLNRDLINAFYHFKDTNRGFWDISQRLLNKIIIKKSISEITGTREFDEILKFLSLHQKDIEAFRELNIKVGIDFYISSFNSERLKEICIFLWNKKIDFINFVFTFPRPIPDSICLLKSQLEDFCEDIYCQEGDISFINLPFCFIPDTEYRRNYKSITTDLKGDIHKQREEISRLKNTSYSYHEPCQECRRRLPCYSYSAIKDFSDYRPYLKKPMSQNTILFAGGSLHPHDRKPDVDIFYSSPAEQGDIFIAILEGFKNILIIDGYFDHKFPCTTFEVMLALERGIHVFGSSSIGALRAVELDYYGMVGLGYVYDYLKDKPIKPYHVVAQLYDINNRSISTPLISIIYFLDLAMNKGIITKGDFDKIIKAANAIHFSDLTFVFFFRHLYSCDKIPAETCKRLEDYFSSCCEDSFDVKRKDALFLLNNFKAVIVSRNTRYVTRAFNLAKKKQLKILYNRYKLGYRLNLPADWRMSFKKTIVKIRENTRNRREQPPQKTLKLAKRFFEGLDVTIADMSRYERVDNFVINVFFVPFYFLQYPFCTATGNGDNFEESLVCAYMELVERIPIFYFKVNSLPKDKVSGKNFPYNKLPQFYNLDIPEKIKKQMVKKYGYVKVTEIINNQRVFIPAYAAMATGSGTDGNASGNSLLEAILYGLYELIERDTTKIYDYINLKLQSLLVIDNKTLKDKRLLSLIDQFQNLGCKPVLLNYVNIFSIPCIRCFVLDQDNRILRHSSTVARLDYHFALFEALSEAYMSYMTYFTGTRDDYVSAYGPEKTYLFRHFCSIFARAKPKTAKFLSIKLDSLKEEFSLLIKRISTAGIDKVIVVNNSPLNKYQLKSVKVIIPGTELNYISPYRASSVFDIKLKKTISNINAYLKAGL